MIDKFNQGVKTTKQIVKEFFAIYNEVIPHYSNYMLTPKQMHSQKKKGTIRSNKAKNSSKDVFDTV